MTLNIGDNFKLREDGGDLAIEHIPSGGTLEYDDSENAWVPTDPIGTSGRRAANIATQTMDAQRGVVSQLDNDGQSVTLDDDVDAASNDVSNVGKMSSDSATVTNQMSSGSVSTDDISGTKYVGDGDTIQDAINSLGDNGHIIVTPDYDSSAEILPITISDKVLHIEGAGIQRDSGPTGGVLDFSANSNANVFELNWSSGFVSADVERMLIENLTIIGGKDGIVLEEGIGQSVFKNIMMRDQAGRGVVIESSGISQNSNIFQNIYIRDTGSHGFNVETGSGANNTRLLNCNVISAGSDGARLETGVGHVFIGCDISACSSEGIVNEARATYVLGCYFEGNDSSSGNFEISSNNTIHIGYCRFRASNNHNTDDVVLINGGTKSTIGNIIVRGIYQDGIVNIGSNSTAVNVVSSTIQDVDGTGLISADRGDLTKVNSIIGGGEIGGVDIGSATGAQEGDIARSNGTNANSTTDELFVLKSNGDWQSIADPSTTITPS